MTHFVYSAINLPSNWNNADKMLELTRAGRNNFPPTADRNSMSDKPEVRPFESKKIRDQPYPITKYQPINKAEEFFEDVENKILSALWGRIVARLPFRYALCRRI